MKKEHSSWGIFPEPWEPGLNPFQRGPPSALAPDPLARDQSGACRGQSQGPRGTLGGSFPGDLKVQLALTQEQVTTVTSLRFFFPGRSRARCGQQPWPCPERAAGRGRTGEEPAPQPQVHGAEWAWRWFHLGGRYTAPGAAGGGDPRPFQQPREPGHRSLGGCMGSRVKREPSQASLVLSPSLGPREVARPGGAAASPWRVTAELHRCGLASGPPASGDEALHAPASCWRRARHPVPVALDEGPTPAPCVLRLSPQHLLPLPLLRAPEWGRSPGSVHAPPLSRRGVPGPPGPTHSHSHCLPVPESHTSPSPGPLSALLPRTRVLPAGPAPTHECAAEAGSPGLLVGRPVPVCLHLPLPAVPAAPSSPELHHFFLPPAHARGDTRVGMWRVHTHTRRTVQQAGGSRPGGRKRPGPGLQTVTLPVLPRPSPGV